MLASRTSGAFVCLRCELRRAQPRITALRRTPSHVNFSRSSHRRDAFDETAPDAQTEQPRLKIIREVRPLNRIRRKKGKLIHEQSAPLGGLKVLGQDADILLVNEVDNSKFVETPKEARKKAELLEVPDILASLQKDKNLTPEEINKKIESLRPSLDPDSDGQQYVTKAVYAKLVKALKDGFTVMQLREFYSYATNITDREVWDDVMNKVRKDHKSVNSSVERSQWQPGTTDFSQRKSWLRYNYTPKNSKNIARINKSLLVDQILRKIWNLAPLEEMETLGELDMMLQPWQFGLLERGGRDSKLNAISRSRKVQLQFYAPANLLRITANKYSAEYAAQDVDDIMRDTSISMLYMSKWAPLLPVENISEKSAWHLVFSKETLDKIMYATHTFIYGGDKSVLVIRGLNRDSAQEATQILLRHLPRKDSPTQNVDLARVEAAGAERYMIPINAETSDDSIGAVNFPEDLGRWTLPIARNSVLKTKEVELSQDSKSTSPTLSDTKDLDLESIVSRVQASMNAELVVPPETGENPWKDTLSCSLQADFGNALFPLAATSPRHAHSSPNKAQSSFQGTLPGLTPLIYSTDFTTRSRTKAPALSYNFIPAPQQTGFSNDQLFPGLNIRLRPSLGEQLKFKLSLTVKTSIHDVCLPDKAVDVRFSRSARLNLFNPELYPETEAWMKTVLENIESGGRVTAPPLSLEIPNWTIPGNTKDPQSTTSVNYLFTGVEMQEWLSAQFLDTRAAFKTSRSGKFGQKQSVLKAFADSNTQSDIFKPDEQELEGFVKSCLGMADKITKFATGSRTIAKLYHDSRNSVRESRRSGRQTKNLTDVAPSTSNQDVADLTDVAADIDIDGSENEDAAISEVRENATS